MTHPCLAGANQMDRGQAHTKLIANLSQERRSAQGANLVNVLPCQLDGLRPLAVCGVCHRLHVFGVHARWIAAHVVEFLAIRDRPVALLVKELMRKLVELSCVGNPAVTIAVAPSRPYPAARNTVDAISNLGASVVVGQEARVLAFTSAVLGPVLRDDRRVAAAATLTQSIGNGDIVRGHADLLSLCAAPLAGPLRRRGFRLPSVYQKAHNHAEFAAVYVVQPDGTLKDVKELMTS